MTIAPHYGIRPSDRRDTLVGFAALFLVMAAHAVLEAARDALFLATLPVTMLPWTYLLMAVLALLAVGLNKRALRRFSRRRTLSLSLALGSVITLGFWTLSSLAGSAWSLLTFYVWTGLLATVLVMQFWLLLADVVDIGQARRTFATIGAGGLAGAVAGSALAAGMVAVLPPQVLLLAASSLLGIAALLPRLFTRRPVPGVDRPSDSQPGSSPSAFGNLWSDHYLRRLLVLVMVSTVMLTGVDYVFKAVVAAEIPSHELGSFFARYYAVINALALGVQLVVAPRLLRTAGVTHLLLVMPIVLLGTGLGFAAAISLTSVMLLRGADGVLRHSINRTGVELLYLPLSARIRDKFKGFAEAVGQRGGQAVASLLILAAIWVELSTGQMALLLVIFGLLWIVCIKGLRPHYIELFRRQLREGAIDTRPEVHELDLHSLEVLVSGLSSEEDAEVIAALDMFAAYQRTHLVPALILYHPSPTVVLRAFEIFSGSNRRDVLRASARVLRHSDEEVRAAALRHYAAHAPSEALLRSCLEDPSPAVRTTATVGLIAGGWLGGEEAERQLWELVHGPSPEARQALALAFHLLPPDRFAELADELIGSDEPGLVTLMTRSLAAQPSLAYIDTLIQSLAERDARAEARQALIKLGRPALARLEQALWDDEQPRRVRRHLPRTISRFEPHRATMILIRRLRVEPDPAVSFKILRGLGRLRASAPWTPIDRDLLFDLLQRMLERSTALLHWGQLIERAHARGARPRLRSAELLIAALLDLEQHAAERAFRLLHIIEPTEEFWMIYDGLRSADAKVRASSRELLSMVVPEPMRQGIIALVDDAPPLERLAGAATFLEPVRRTRVTELLALLERDPGEVREQFDAHYKEALRAMLVDESRMLREVVRDYARDLGLTELGGNLVPTPAERRRFWRSHLRPEVTGAS